MPMQTAPATAEQKADELLASIKPLVVKMIERYDPAHREVTFNEIESDAASRGDLLARELMKLVLARQGNATATEVQAAREAMAAQQAPAGGAAEAAPMTRMPDRRRRLKTMRGEIDYRREYLYFPDAQSGVFPPRPTAGHS
jgi:hypothetical protein